MGVSGLRGDIKRHATFPQSPKNIKFTDHTRTELTFREKEDLGSWGELCMWSLNCQRVVDREYLKLLKKSCPTDRFD